MTTHSKPRLTRTAPLALALASSLLILAGCASTPKPVEKLAVAEAAVKRASTTTTSVNAPAELQIAIAKLASARDAADREDYARAAELAEQAAVDAEVAQLHAQSVRSRRSADESKEAAEALREEINRKTPR